MSQMPRELVSRLEAKIDGLSDSIGALRTVAARIGDRLDAAHEAANKAVLRADDHHNRITSLEETRSQARGAAFAVKVFWVCALAGGGFLEWYFHRG